MRKNLKGKVVGIKPVIRKTRLRIACKIQLKDQGEVVKAFLPDREVSALLPRSVLLGDIKKAHRSLLKTIQSIINRLIMGREVRVWQYEKIYYFSFLSWRQIAFGEE